MKLVVFGLSISSAWGNGHATLLRGLFRALHRQGHEVHFFERDVPYYAQHRDASSFPYVHLHLYADWKDIAGAAQTELADADIGMITSYCPDAADACALVLNEDLWRRVFYDMDTPVTFARRDRGEVVEYLPAEGLSGFDLVLSYTGGHALHRLKSELGARAAVPLYGWVDPEEYYPDAHTSRFSCDLSYLGTYSADRQPAVDEMVIRPAAALPAKNFIIAGAMYSDRSSWPCNIGHFEHVAPPQHRAFYCSSATTLNVTRASMAHMGFCPSGRLFEATACGTVVLTDTWLGLDTFFQLGSEVVPVTTAADVVRVLSRCDFDLQQIASRGRERTLECHTAAIRAREFLNLLENVGAEGHVPALRRVS